MASNKRKSTTKTTTSKAGSKTSSKKPAQTRKKTQKNSSKQGGGLSNEIQGVFIAAVGLLVFACLFVRDTAVVPDVIAGFMFGMFGLAAYLVPIAALFFGVCRIILKKFTYHLGKIISTVVFVLCVSGILQLILSGTTWATGSFFEAISSVYTSASQASFPLSMGGFTAVYVYPIVRLFGEFASYVVFLCGIAISVILLFNFSYHNAGRKVKEKIEIIHENNTRRAEQRKENKPVKMFDDLIEEDLQGKTPRKKGKRHVLEDEVEDSPLSFDIAAPVDLGNFDYSGFNEPDFADHVENSIFDTPGEAEPELVQPETDIEEQEQGAKAETVSSEFTSFDLPKEPDKYVFPPLAMLSPPKPAKSGVQVNYAEMAAKLERTLASFGIKAHVINYTVGPAITRYELTLEEGIRVNKILALSDDISLSMAATGVRIEAPIPGKSAIGIEIPNLNVTMVCLREVLESDNFRNHPSCVSIGLGKDITGRAIVADIAKMPHLLIAGQTGSGKSVAINSLIVSILYKATPEEVRLILVDPKQVELNIYNGIPHLLLPVVTDPKKAAGALQYVVRQMEKRYSTFNKHKVKDVYRYNEQAKASGEPIMPRIVVIVDELNDLMMVCPGEVEDSVLRIAQLARAAGIYLVLATQRPSVNVITGVIKANIPSRMAFAVASTHDSKTILDRTGAERLVGKGDMLYHHNGESKPLRVQGAYVDERDVEKIVTFIKENALEPEYIDEQEIIMVAGDAKGGSIDPEEEGYDELIFKAVDIIMQNEQASISLLQRKLGIGYARAGRLIDSMEEMRIVGPSQGSKPREILITQEQYIQNYKRK